MTMSGNAMGGTRGGEVSFLLVTTFDMLYTI